MAAHTGEAHWNGTLFGGKGTIKVSSWIFDVTYTAAMRFENERGTNPEELIGAALAGCFSQALSLNLENAGFNQIEINTKATVHLKKTESGYKISTINLVTQATVPTISPHQFQQIAEVTKNTCPVSQALSVPIT